MRFVSDLAILTAQPRDVTNRTKKKAYGVLVHTTGVGVLARAQKWKCTPLKAAERIYSKRGASFAHYVIGQDGTIIQIADERERAWQAGMPREQLKLYKSGMWVKKCPRRIVKMWEDRWGPGSTPADLYPSRSPNNDYIGIEMVPNKNTKFSKSQLEIGLPALVADIFIRHGIKFSAKDLMSTRLLGHEDVEPLERWNRRGGWDPGTLRDRPKFKWDDVYKTVHKLMKGKYNHSRTT